MSRYIRFTKLKHLIFLNGGSNTTGMVYHTTPNFKNAYRVECATPLTGLAIVKFVAGGTHSKFC
jgi:hypothetical protein